MEQISQNLQTYLEDHLAGGEFAISLLNDLVEGCAVQEVTRLAAELLPEIEADRAVLLDVLNRAGAGRSTLKEAVAWIVQQVSRFKLRLAEPIGTFQAVEVLQLGVQGKLALWNALSVLSLDSPTLKRTAPRPVRS